MGSEPLVVDLSSDDEDGGGFDGDGIDMLKELSFDWVSEFFSEEKGEGEESDDVVVVDELSAPPAVKERQNMGVLRQKDCILRDDSDDDCMVLDFDPEQSAPVEVAADGKVGGGDEEDDLVVVHEKGQVACRDYPHPRHLCAKFLFNVSPHSEHCNLCHCYVCDSLAPCKYWGNGDLTTDHCHSTDKDEKWKSLRLSFRQRSMPSQPAKLVHNALSNMPSPGQLSNMPPPGQCPPPLIRRNRFPQIPSSPISNPIRRCSTASARFQRHVLQPARPIPLNSAVPAHKEARFSGALAPQFMHSRFKRAGATPSSIRLNTNGLIGTTLVSNNQILRPACNKDYGTTNRSQRPQHLQPVGHSSDYLTSVAAGASMNNPVHIAVSDGLQPFPTMLPTYQCPSGGASVNDNCNSWSSLLATVANDLGVSINSGGSTYAEEPTAIPPPPVDYTLFQPNTDQFTDFVAQHATDSNISPLDTDGDRLINNNVNDTIEHVHGGEPEPSTVQLTDALPPGCDSGYDELQISNILASVEEMLGEPESDVPLPDLDPNEILYDLPWSSFVPIPNNSYPP